VEQEIDKVFKSEQTSQFVILYPPAKQTRFLPSSLVQFHLSSQRRAASSGLRKLGFGIQLDCDAKRRFDAEAKEATRMTERRTARRYDLSLPIRVRLPIEKGAVSRAGKTRDISTRGVYFTIDNNLSAGAELNLTMILPAKVTGATEVCIRATGKVIRMDKRSGNGDQEVDVAAAFEMYEIVRNEAAIA
jgi:PilZ domain